MIKLIDSCFKKEEIVMKAGIITYHRAYNYGSALQNYALNYYLRSEGVDAATIDYQNENQENMYKIFQPNNGVMSVLRNIQSLMYYKDLKLHKKRFDSFLLEYIPMTESIRSSEKLSELNKIFDYFICGSDQIWNASCYDFDKSYLLDFVKDKKKCVSFAPSIAIAEIPEDWNEMFREHIIDYKAVSLREQKGADFISKVINKPVPVLMDPVFLLSEEEWSKLSVELELKNPYIFCYFIGDVRGMREFAKNMRKATKLPLVVVYKNIRDMAYPNKKLYGTGPREFLGLIKNAEYICTNSFHATAFSIIFKKNFWAFTDIEHAISAGSRIDNITSLFGLKNRVLNYTNMDKVNFTEQIMFTDEMMKIRENKSDEAKSFLKNALDI